MSNDVNISSQPHSPDNRALARVCKDVKIDRVYIGSCTGGKTEDFMAAAKIFLASVRRHYLCYIAIGQFLYSSMPYLHILFLCKIILDIST
jgi:homoaconitase/3-isopropylmalate dehydratase large subunit